MILQINHGNPLELFWRQPRVSQWTYRTAFDFLSRFVSYRDGLRGLREALAERGGATAMLPASNRVALHRGATFISAGELIVAQYRYTHRRPGTGKVLGPRWNSVLLIWRDDLHPAPDLEAALGWLKQIEDLEKKVAEAKKDKRGDSQRLILQERELADLRRELDQVRQLAASGPGVPDFSYLKQPDFIEQLERVLQSGELLPIYHRPTGLVDSVAAAPPPSSSPPLRSGTDREDAPESNTFPTNHEAAAQGATLTEAAEDGVPFCEMCAKMAAEEAASRQ